MFKQAFVNFSDSNLIVIGFMLFLVTFLGVCIWTIFVQKNSFYDELSKKALINGDEYGRQ